MKCPKCDSASLHPDAAWGYPLKSDAVSLEGVVLKCSLCGAGVLVKEDRGAIEVLDVLENVDQPAVHADNYGGAP